MRRESTEVSARGDRGRGRPGPMASASKRSRLRRLTLEALEQRTLMATSPISVVSGQSQVSIGSNKIDDSSPWVAVDPVNPLKMVSVYTHRDTSSGNVVISSVAKATVDGGKTWTINAFTPGNLLDPTTSNPVVPYANAKGSGVGIDQNENVYIGVLEVNGGNSGAVVVNKYSFKTGSLVFQSSNLAYQWNQADDTNIVPGAAREEAIVNFTLAVDDNVASYMDPNTNAVQTDPNAGNVYIAWTTNKPPPSSPPNPYNPYTIEILASTDGTYSPVRGQDQAIPVSSGHNFVTAGFTEPRIAISQGKPGTIGGQVTTVWDDFGSLSGATPPEDLIQARTMTFTGASLLSSNSIVNVATTFVRGAAAPNYSITSAASAIGIGPGAAVAVDNTLGSFSQHQGRIYVAYTERYNDPLNQTDNTDIQLTYSDNFGASWSSPIQVNDDSGYHDGHTGGVLPTDPSAHFAGRSQFEPSVAVDKATGTLALSWLDARDDASRQRYADYLTTSIDGGSTFAPDVFADQPNIVTDAITGKAVVVGPYSNNPTIETSLGVGTHQALAIANGTIRPVWVATLKDGLTGARQTIETAQATYAYGPRVISSTMGPVVGAAVNGFTLTFDRPVDISTFTTGDVQVFYRNVNAPIGTTGVSIPVGTVTAINPGGIFAGEATQFLVRFQSPQSGVGTYSYSVGPKVSDRLRIPAKVSLVSDGTPPTSFPQTVNSAIPDSPNGSVQSIITVPAGAPGTVVNMVTVQVTLTHPHDSDLSIVLVSPDGVAITLSSGHGGAGANYNGTIFDDSAGLSIANGTAPFSATFRPDQRLSLANGGSVGGNWRLVVTDNSPGFTGTFVSWKLTLQTGTVILNAVGDGNVMDQNADGVAGGPGDIYATPRPLGGTPFQGPYDTATLPLILPGPHIIGTNVPGGVVGSAENLVTDAKASVIVVTFDRPMDASTFTPAQVLSMMGPAGPITGPFTITPVPGDPTSFSVGFPIQALSGTYQIVLGTGIRSQAGDAVDTNQNAGIDRLFDRFDPSNPNQVQVSYAATGLPASGAIAPGTTTTVQIPVNDVYTIQDLQLTLNATYPNDPDLTGTLTFQATNPDGTPNGTPITITLFQNLPNIGPTGSRGNFNTTIFTNRTTDTPIQNGAPQYNGRFSSQTPFTPFLGLSSQGVFTLSITNKATGTADATNTGTINNVLLTLTRTANAGVGTGLGEPVGDRSQVSFRIFTMDPTNPLSSSTWTAVGPASNNGNGNSSRITGFAIDPSDPSGNTAFVGGASGGVWKTYNFLTTSSRGPTYIPLTDTGPSFSLNIGSIAVFPRNSDPRQSIVVVGTGEGDSGSQGVGFLISFNGGTTWSVLDSTHNVNADGTEIPAAQRDHAFVGTSMFKVLVDPHPTPTGDVIIYAAVAGRDGRGNARGGIWRSLDSGRDWTLVRAGSSSTGDATDITFDPNSGAVDAFSNPTGNIRTLYAAFLGDGVYSTPNQGGTWNLLAGGIGDPLIQDVLDNPARPITVNAPPATPNGAKGRIELAKPALTGNAIEDIQYQTWLYAAVATPGGALDGLYLTKDNGQNWTKVRIPNYSVSKASSFNGTSPDTNPSNDISLPDDNLLGNQGNYNIALTIDPNNPNVVYIGGTAPNVIRVDVTRLADPHALFVDPTRPGGGLLENTTSPITIKDPKNLHLNLFFISTGLPVPNPISAPYLNLLRDPNSPFTTNSTIYVADTQSFTNDGSGAYWTPFNFAGGSDVHRLITIKDQVTGKTRLVVALDQGIFSAIDNGDGTYLRSVGTDTLPFGSRNGNLQINQFYNGSAQPSSLAAAVAGALFYGMAQDNGFPQSSDNIDKTLPGGATNGSYGSLAWSGSTGDGQDTATDQTGSGTSYSYRWPCCGGNVTDFFQVADPGAGPVGRTFGLIQQSQTGNVPDPQWPNLGGFNFAVNPVSGQQIVMGSAVGRFFGTEDEGRIWHVIAEPGVLDGTVINAPAFGAPDPNGPGVPGALDNYILAGTQGGKIFVSFVGGGGGAANAWTNISNGLPGNEPVLRIITNPNRGSHEAYAITSGHVFHNVNTSAAGTTWVDITNNVFSLMQNPFGDALQVGTSLKYLSSLVADWRYVIPDNPALPNGSTHPMLYVAGESGVYRSTDGGKTWGIFPDLSLNGPVVGGYLPDAHVSDLDMVLGNVNPTTGRPDVSTGPNLLLATTYGRGSFGIRLAPIIFNDGTNNVALSTTLPAPGGSDTGKFNNDNITKDAQPFFTGLSEQSAFGNQVAITIYDVTVTASNPTGAPIYVGGYNPGDQTGDVGGFFNVANQTDAFGRFNVQITQPLLDGTHTVQLVATDASGTRGNLVSYTFQLITVPPGQPNAPILEAASDTGPSNSDGYTRITNPTFDVTPTVSNATIILLRRSLDTPNAPYVQVNTVLIPAGAPLVPTAITDPGPVPDGHYVYATEILDLAGNQSPQSVDSATITIDTIAPNTPGTPTLALASDSGVKGDNITNVTSPTLIVMPGESAPTLTELFRSTDPTQVGTLAGTASGAGAVQDTGPLASGTYYYRAQQVDLAGNASPLSVNTAFVAIQIIQSIPGARPTVALFPTDDSGVKGDNTTNVTQPRVFGVAPVAPANGPGYTLELVNATTGAIITSIPEPNNGNYVLQFPAPLPDGPITIFVRVRDVADNTLSSTNLTLTILTHPPTLVPTLDIAPADRIPADLSTPADPLNNFRSTVVRKPHLTGKTQPGVLVQITDAAGNLEATVSSKADGSFIAQLPFDLTNGTIQLFAKATDVAGNQTATAGELTLKVTFVQGDYNGDGKADLAVYRPSTATFYTSSTGASPYGFAGHDLPIAGDFFGNGLTDVAVFRPETATWFINGGSLGQTMTQFGWAGHDTPIPAVYDRSGRTELAVYRSETATWYILHADGNGLQTTPFGYAGHSKAVPADYDGNGFAQIAVYFPLEQVPASQGGGAWYIRDINTGMTRTVAFPGAKAGDIPVPGDYDGVGKAEEALYRPSTGQYLILNPSTNAVRTVNVGAANVDMPVPADYDGDGRLDAAVFHPSTATWTYIGSSTGQTTSSPFGTSTDIPVPAPLQNRINASLTATRVGIPAAAVASGTAPTARAAVASPAPVVVGVTTPSAPTKVKATVRPNDANQVRQPVKLAQPAARQGTEVKDPIGAALAVLGRSYKGLFFG